jgi:hypothetical protein
LGKIFVSFWNFQPLLRKSTKFVFEFCGLDLTGRLALVDTATSVASTMIFYEFPRESFALLFQQYCHEKLLSDLHYRKICKQLLTHSLDRNHHAKLSRWKSLRGWDSRPQLVAVSGLFGGNPFVGGILGHNLLLSLAFFLVGIPS